MYLAIDPGETAGYAFFDEDGEVSSFGQFSLQESADWLIENITSSLKMVIVEDYRNFAWKQQKKWSDNKTSQQIGAIKLACHYAGVPLTLQPANVLKIGLKFLGIGDLPSNHDISHQFSAAAHGAYYLKTHGIRKAGAGIPDELK